MLFVGQGKIIRELDIIIPRIIEGTNINILLVAPSGYGKTTLAYWILKRLGFDNCHISYPGNDFWFEASRRFHLIDEVHELKTPELFYERMENGNYTFILATNETGEIKEPMLNRCIPLIFEKYSYEEMKYIVRISIDEFKLDESVISEIANKGGGNPRIIKQLCQRLIFICKSGIVPRNVEELNQILDTILNIDREGLNPYERRYLEFLRNCGGRASLSLLQNGTRIDKNTILRDIEPKLLYNKTISITSKGRTLV